MSDMERKDRIQFLWKRLRIVVKHRGLLHRIFTETLNKERERFGLDPEHIFTVEPDQELES